MGKEWPYSKLSEKAAEMGGADKVLAIINDLEIIKNEEFAKGTAKGASDMAGKMAPWFVVVAGASVAGTLFVQEIRKRAIKKKEERSLSAERAAEAEARLIDSLSQREKTGSGESESAIEEE